MQQRETYKCAHPCISRGFIHACCDNPFIARLVQVQQAALWVVGTTVQSHLKMQEMIRQRGALPKILSKIRQAAGDIGPSDPRLLAKALYAISTLLRYSTLSSQNQYTPHNGGISKHNEIVSRILKRPIAV
jgi:hypothetical protein